MFSLVATIDPQIVLLDTLIFGVILLLAGILLSLSINKQEIITRYSFEKISTDGFTYGEMIASTLVVLFFSVNVWLPLVWDPQSQPSELVINEFNYALGFLLTMAIQFIVPSVILLFLLAQRTNLLDALGLRNCQWGRISFFMITGLVAAYTSMLLMKPFGLEEWLTKTFGIIEDQAAVQAMKNAASPLRQGLMIFAAVIIAPICEEILFRSFLYTATKKYTGVLFAAISSALLFSVIHGSIKALIPLFVVGLILALAYELSGSLWANILIHAMFNLISVISILSI